MIFRTGDQNYIFYDMPRLQCRKKLKLLELMQVSLHDVLDASKLQHTLRFNAVNNDTTFKPDMIVIVRTLSSVNIVTGMTVQHVKLFLDRIEPLWLSIKC